MVQCHLSREEVRSGFFLSSTAKKAGALGVLPCHPEPLLWLIVFPLGCRPWNTKTINVEHSSIKKPTGTTEIISAFGVDKPLGVGIDQDVRRETNRGRTLSFNHSVSTVYATLYVAVQWKVHSWLEMVFDELNEAAMDFTSVMGPAKGDWFLNQ